MHQPHSRGIQIRFPQPEGESHLVRGLPSGHHQRSQASCCSGVRGGHGYGSVHGSFSAGRPCFRSCFRPCFRLRCGAAWGRRFPGRFRARPCSGGGAAGGFAPAPDRSVSCTGSDCCIFGGAGPGAFGGPFAGCSMSADSRLCSGLCAANCWVSVLELLPPPLRFR